MVVFHINLIRGTIAPPRTRRRIFWGMLLYLGVCGGVLAAIANRATHRLVAVSEQGQQIVKLADAFRQKHPGEADMAGYAERLRQEAAAYAEKMEAIGGIRDRRVDAARVLLALTRPLPRDVDLVNFRMDGQKRTLDFELAFPVRAAGGSEAGALLDIWNQEATIRANVGRIGSVRSQRNTIQGDPVELLTFAGAGVDKGK
jgi:hypothetical protein